MMEIAQIAIYLLALGAVYGSLSQRLKHVEKEIEKNENLSDRLARLEEKINFIYQSLKTK